MSQLGGRQVEIGIGIETSAGTPVAAADSFKWDSFSMQAISDKILLQSARGLRNKTSNSVILKKYGKGSLEFVPTVDILPYILGLTLGTRSSGTHSGESAVYDHTFTIQNANASMKTATFFVKQGSGTIERYSNCVVDSFDLTVEKDFAKCKIGIYGNYPDTGSFSPSYTQDTLFTRNQMNATFGSTLTTATPTAATSTLSTTGVFSDGDLITVGNFTYTIRTTLSSGGNIPYEVLAGAAATNTLDNLKSAVNGTGTPGTTYGFGTNKNTQVLATTKTVSSLVVVAIIAGTNGNSIATTKTATNASWVGATLASGAGNNATPLVAFSLSIANNVLFEQAFLSGSAQPGAGAFIAGPLQIKGSYTAQFTDMVEYEKYKQNTNMAMIVNIVGAALGTVSTQELIQFKIGRIVLTKAPLEYQLDDIMLVKQEFEVQYDATDKELTAIIINNYVGTNYQ